MEILERLAAYDDHVVERLCRAHAEGLLGERELHAARLAAEQLPSESSGRRPPRRASSASHCF
jgi:hypothetical protein